MCQLPSQEAVRGMLGEAISEDVTVTAIQALPSFRPQRLYRVDLSDDRKLHLVLPPLSMWRPLRSEQSMVGSEATAVRWIRSHLERSSSGFGHDRCSSCSSSPPSSSDSPRGGKERRRKVEEATGKSTTGKTRIGARSALDGKDSTSTATTDDDDTNDNDQSQLLRLLPLLMHHGQELSLFREPFAFYTTAKGIPLSLLTPPLPPDSPRRESIQFQLGHLSRRLAGILSPTGRFGPLAAIVPPTANARQQDLGAGGLFGTSGAGTWSVAFHSMLEGALRDGEDMAVVLGYSAIRRHFRRLGYLLDEVTTARLVVMDVADESNTLVSTDSEGKDGENEEENTTAVVGLSDWSFCFFGDPLLATAFSDPLQLPQPPSAAFLRGFNSSNAPSSSSSSSETEMGFPACLDRVVIENVDTAWIRLLLYQVYHAVTRIVREFYRPRDESSARELEARRKLNVALAKLAEVPDDVRKKQRHPRPSGDMSPAKRIRTLELGS